MPVLVLRVVFWYGMEDKDRARELTETGRGGGIAGVTEDMKGEVKEDGESIAMVGTKIKAIGERFSAASIHPSRMRPEFVPVVEKYVVKDMRQKATGNGVCREEIIKGRKKKKKKKKKKNRTTACLSIGWPSHPTRWPLLSDPLHFLFFFFFFPPFFLKARKGFLHALFVRHQSHHMTHSIM